MTVLVVSHLLKQVSEVRSISVVAEFPGYRNTLVSDLYLSTDEGQRAGRAPGDAVAAGSGRLGEYKARTDCRTPRHQREAVPEGRGQS